MTTATPTLTEFLLARYDEREATASNYLRFEVRDGIPGNYAIRDEVLADIEAKRRIVELHEHHEFEVPDYYSKETVGCVICHSTDMDFAGGWCDTIKAVALPYADHPDYREEWRP